MDTTSEISGWALRWQRRRRRRQAWKAAALMAGLIGAGALWGVAFLVNARVWP
jgi:cation transport regulator ChaC